MISPPYKNQIAPVKFSPAYPLDFCLTDWQKQFALPQLKRYAANMSTLRFYMKRELMKSAFKHVFMVPIQSKGTGFECYLCMVWIEQFNIPTGTIISPSQLGQVQQIPKYPIQLCTMYVKPALNREDLEWLVQRKNQLEQRLGGPASEPNY